MNYPAQKPNDQLAFLDGLRGLAAFYVMIGHARWLLWEGYSTGYLLHPDRYSFFDKVQMYFFSMFTFGHEAVLFFFVLSGFVIHIRYSRKLLLDPQNTTFDWISFYFRRAKRIYPPLLFALLVTFIFDTIGTNLLYPIYFKLTPYELINNNINNSHSLIDFFGNLFLVMGSYVPVWGSNGPLWSLKYEWWFYMFYPFFFYLSKFNQWVATLTITTLYLLSYVNINVFGSFISDIFSMMLAWWFGVILADIFTKRNPLQMKFVTPFALLIPVLLFKKDFGFDRDILWALGFTGILSITFLTQKSLLVRIISKFRALGEMSYTLYVSHFPILVFLSGWITAKSYENLLPAHFGFIYLGIILTLSIAWFTHLIIERPFYSRKF